MKRKSAFRRFKVSVYAVVQGFILLNLLIIDGWLVMSLSGNRNILGTSTACPKACLNYLHQTAKSSGTSSKEYFIPLGSGTNQSDDWQDVAGAQAEIDTAQYRRIKRVTLETTLEVPASSQISYVRLYNVTDQHPVWFSESSMEGSGPKLLLSSPITLDEGRKTYRVQMKSQLKALTKLIQSRLHVQTY